MNIAFKASEGLEWLGVSLAIFFTGAFLFVATQSMTYPFQLEWMEGQIVDVIGRVMHGQPLYVAPSLEYVPFIYTPFYFYVGALVSYITGLDFFAARLVSFLAIIGCGAVIYLWIRKEEGSRKAAFIGCGLFFATYKLSGRWFDLAREDSLFLCFCLAGLYALYWGRGWRAAWIAAAWLAAAFFTKQTTVMMALPALVGMMLVDYKQALKVLGLWLWLLAIGIGWYEIRSDGWFNFYVFIVPSGHPIIKYMIKGFWLTYLLRPLGYVIPVVLAYFFLLRHDLKKAAFYGALLAGCIAAGFLSTLHSGGYLNVLMPMHAALALLAGLALKETARWNRYGAVAISLLLIIQMARLVYNPMPLIPTEESLEQGNKFVQELSQLQGDVFISEIQFIPTKAGKKSYDFGYAASDIFRTNAKGTYAVKAALQKELDQALQQHRFAAVIPGKYLSLKVRQFYPNKQTLAYAPHQFVSGIIDLPANIFYATPQAGDRELN